MASHWLERLLALCALLVGEAAQSDWCPVQTQHIVRGADDTDGLKGMDVRCGAIDYPPFSMYDEATGAWSGYDIELFTKIAQKGGFSVDFTKLDVPLGGDYNTLLFSTGKDMDIMCSWFAETARRKKQGFDFTGYTIDASLVLVGKIPQKVKIGLDELLWTFLRPFSKELWLVVLFSVVFTSILMWAITPNKRNKYLASLKNAKGLGPKKTLVTFAAKAENFLLEVCEMFYQGWCMCTIMSMHDVANKWSKTYTIAWSALVLILVSAYTAELTSFLILDRLPVDVINTVEDLLKSKQPACIMPSRPTVTAFKRQSAPALPVKEVDNIEDVLPAIRSGECAVGILGQGEAEILLADNNACDMRIASQPLNFITGAYTASNLNCGGFVLTTVDAILNSLREDGHFDTLWETYTRPPSGCTTIASSSVEIEAEDADLGLSLEAVTGVLVIHAAVSFVAFLGFLGSHLYKRRRNASLGKTDDNDDSCETPGSFLQEPEGGQCLDVSVALELESCSPASQLHGKSMSNAFFGFFQRRDVRYSAPTSDDDDVVIPRHRQATEPTSPVSN